MKGTLLGGKKESRAIVRANRCFSGGGNIGKAVTMKKEPFTPVSWRVNAPTGEEETSRNAATLSRCTTGGSASRPRKVLYHHRYECEFLFFGLGAQRSGLLGPNPVDGKVNAATGVLLSVVEPRVRVRSNSKR